MADTAKGGAAPMVIWAIETAKALELTTPNLAGAGATGRKRATDDFFRTAS